MSARDQSSLDATLASFRGLRDLQPDHHLELLGRYRDSGLVEEQAREQQQRTRAAQGVLAAFRQQQLDQYDILHRAGFSPNEQSLSVAVASLLDPMGAHGLGLAPITALLKALRPPTAEAGDPASVIQALEQDSTSVRVKLERREVACRPDIQILARGCLVFIEHKLVGGMETMDHGVPQTIRQWKALQGRCKEQGIAPARRLAVFLTPAGRSAKCEHFTPLAVDDLLAAWSELLDAPAANATTVSLAAFFNFYSAFGYRRGL